MNRSAKISIAVAILFATINLCPDQSASAGGNGGWGWAKPMNKRLGAFYTSNKNANFSRSSSSHTRSAYTPSTAPAANRANAIMTPVAVPHFVAPQHIHVIPNAIQPATATAMPANPLAHPVNPVSQPAVPVPADATAPDVLPFRSTSNSFWQ